ncbi:hypothetical protein VTN02DRAFT_2434 [Thermoascus thermophilus]
MSLVKDPLRWSFMLRSHPRRVWLSSRLRLCARRSIASGPHLPHAASQTTSSYRGPGPTASQWLRFALTGTTQHLQNTISKSDLDRHLEAALFEKWPYTNRPIPPWRPVQRKPVNVTAKSLRKELRYDVENLADLRGLIERNVNTAESGALFENMVEALGQTLERCQRDSSYGEILSVLTALVSRLERQGATVSKDIHYLGMQYACLCFSAPALEYHLHGFLRTGYQRLGLQSSVKLVKSLLSAVLPIRFGDPAYDASSMLSSVTGENQSHQDSQHTLGDILYWSDPKASTKDIGTYAYLLGKLGSKRSLRRLWDRLRQQLSTAPGSRDIYAAYSCAMAFVDVGEAEAAAACLKETFELANNALPGIAKSDLLPRLLAEPHVRAALSEHAGEQTFTKVLEEQLRTIENRLGLKWQEEQSIHSNINDPSCHVIDRPPLTTDGESVGFDSVRRLIAEIRARGCSSSRSDLAAIADLLNEHEGAEIPLFTQNLKTGPLEFAWFPQCSPIEFSGTSAGHDHSASSSPASLGLLRGRFNDHGTPLATERSLHLIQLGYLGMRPASSGVDPTGSRARQLGEWKDTGHIVAWDRVVGNFVIVFTGKGRGIIKPGLQSPTLQPPSGLGTVSRLVMPEDPRDFTPSIADVLVREHNAGNVGTYHFDVDSGTNLTP